MSVVNGSHIAWFIGSSSFNINRMGKLLQHVALFFNKNAPRDVVRLNGTDIGSVSLW